MEAEVRADTACIGSDSRHASIHAIGTVIEKRMRERIPHAVEVKTDMAMITELAVQWRTKRMRGRILLTSDMEAVSFLSLPLPLPTFLS